MGLLKRRIGDDRAWRLVRLAALCVLTGLIAGLGAAGFFVMLDAARSFCLGDLANYHPIAPGYETPMFGFERGDQSAPIRRWVLLILPAIGGLVSGWIVFSFAPEAEGHGTDAAIEAYHFKDGLVRKRVPLVKAIASMITLGTGGSAGREGPIAQIGSGFGSLLGRWFGNDPEQRRTLMAAGMAGGIGAIFHAPLAGALFVTEVFYRDPDFEHEVLVPSFISSIVAYSVFGSIFGFHPLLMTPDYSFDTARVLLIYLILALVCAAGAITYVKTFYGVRGLFFGRLRIPNHFKPALGGIVVGLLGFFLPDALGSGYGIVQECLSGNVASFTENILALPSAPAFQALLPPNWTPATAAALLLVVLALAKIATTAFSIGSGGSGGVFGPAVVIGGALGGATGLICARLLPGLAIQPGTFALVGMAGFFAGAANTPVSTIIMVSEMTGNYNLLVPSMLVCIVSYALCRRHQIYEKQLPSRLDAPSKLGNMAGAILRHLTVDQALTRRKSADLVVVPQNASFAELVRRFTACTQACFPVVDQKGLLTGVIDARDIRRIIMEAGVADLIIAGDIETRPTTVTPGDSLLSAVNNLVKTGSNELVVVEEADSRSIVGTLSRSDIMAAYNRQIVGPGSERVLADV